jgi:hypothetical protein
MQRVPGKTADEHQGIPPTRPRLFRLIGGRLTARLVHDRISCAIRPLLTSPPAETSNWLYGYGLIS